MLRQLKLPVAWMALLSASEPRVSDYNPVGLPLPSLLGGGGLPPRYSVTVERLVLIPFGIGLPRHLGTLPQAPEQDERACRLPMYPTPTPRTKGRAAPGRSLVRYPAQLCPVIPLGLPVSMINPCGNFSLTSNVGWHPPLRIVRPQFLASHYY